MKGSSTLAFLDRVEDGGTGKVDTERSVNGLFCSNGHPMGAGQSFCGVCGASVAGSPARGQAPPPGEFRPPHAAPPPPAKGNTERWTVVGLVAAAAAAVAIVFLITRGGDDSGGTTVAQPTTASTSQAPAVSSSSTPPSSSSTPSSSTTPSTSATTTTTVPGPVTVGNASWESVAGGPLGGDGAQSVQDVVATGSGYVAVGVSGSEIVWTSLDGIAWTAQPATGLAGAQLLHVEAAPDGTLVGVGRMSGTQAFTAWTSSDGIGWTMQSPAGGVLPAGGHQVHDLTVYPGGYVAVGSVALSDTDADAAWWTSPDGVTWAAGAVAEPGVQQMFGVAVSDGLIVAAGIDGTSTGIWKAPVGGPFTRIDHVDLTIAASDFDPANTTARVFAWDVAAGGPGFVAVGADQTTAGTSVAAVWVSSDGSQWTRLGNETEYTPNMLHADFTGRAPWTVMDTVVESGGILIVVGRTGAPADPDLVVWESADGFTWRRGAIGVLPGRQYAFGALAQDGRLIVVGEQGPSGAGDGAVWVATPRADAPPMGTWREAPRFEAPDWTWMAAAVAGEDGIVAVGQDSTSTSPSTEGFVWESVDGVVWSRLPSPVVSPGLSTGLESVVSFEGTLIATGWESDGAIWWSGDGSSWQRAVVPGAPGGDIQGVWQGRGQLYAYGYSDSVTPALWTSVDGRTWADTAVGQPPGGDPVVGIAEVADQLVLLTVDPGTGSPSLSVSPDGQAWTRLPDDPAFTDFRVGAGPTTFGDRLVIAGDMVINGVWSPMVLVTTDLDSWELIAFDSVSAAVAGGEQGEVASISVVGSRLFVTGAIPRAGHDHPALWSTADLIFWTRWEPLPQAGGVDDSQALYGIVSGVVGIDSRLVAVGWSRQEGSNPHAAAWTSDNP